MVKEDFWALDLFKDPDLLSLLFIEDYVTTLLLCLMNVKARLNLYLTILLNIYPNYLVFRKISLLGL